MPISDGKHTGTPSKTGLLQKPSSAHQRPPFWFAWALQLGVVSSMMDVALHAREVCSSSLSHVMHGAEYALRFSIVPNLFLLLRIIIDLSDKKIFPFTAGKTKVIHPDDFYELY